MTMKPWETTSNTIFNSEKWENQLHLQIEDYFGFTVKELMVHQATIPRDWWQQLKDALRVAEGRKTHTKTLSLDIEHEKKDQYKYISDDGRH